MKPQYKKRTTRIDIHLKTYGVTKKEYEELDDIDLLIEVDFLIQCKQIGFCGTCKKLLKFCLTILQIVVTKSDSLTYLRRYK